MDSLISGVSSVGFPIVMCLLFFYQTTKTDERMTDILIEMRTLIEDLKEYITHGGTNLQS